MTTLALIVGTILSLFGGHAAGDTGITQLDQFTSTTTPSAAITQRVYGKPIKITGLSTGSCLTLDSGGLITTTACGSGSGFATTSADYWITTKSTSNLAEGSNLYYTDARARAALSLTTAGSSGAATYSSATGVLNIPQYSGTSYTATWPVSISGSTISWAGLATTSQPASSNLIVSNGGTGLYGVATSTLTPSSPLTGSFVQIGSGGSLGIQAANASQSGYLSAADYSLLHTATTTAGTGLTYSGNAFNVNTSQNIATLSNLTGNGFVKTSGGTGALSIDTNTYLTSAVTSVSGTANQITSSGGNTPTLSFPSLIIQPAASTTLFSNFGTAYFGGSSTSTFSATGALALPNIANALKLPALGTAAGTFLAADPSGFVIATTSPSGSGTPANPSASVGLAAVNGSASTYMRSDAAPALSQSIVPTWTGLHTFNTGGFINNASSTFTTTVNFPLGQWTSAGRLGIGTTTPAWALQAAGPTSAPQFGITDNTASNPFHWIFRNIAGDLYLATSSPATYATSTFSNPSMGFIKFPNNGGCVGCTDIVLPSGINLRNAIYGTATSTTQTANVRDDVYTVPTGRRAILTGWNMANMSAGTVTFGLYAKIGGTYYFLTSTSSVATVTAQSGTAVTLVLEAGESFSILQDTTSSLTTTWVNYVEYDASVPLYSPRSLAPGAGTSTLYTVPNGASAFALNGQNTYATNGSAITWRNGTSGSITLRTCLPKSGQTAILGMNCTTASGASLAAGGLGGGFLAGGTVKMFNSGDTIQFYLSASTAGTPSIVWTTVYEH